MSNAPTIRSARVGLPLAVGLLGLVLLALLGVVAPSVALAGWLVGFVAVAGLGLGCTAWLAIHGLTGGRWGDAARPALLAGTTLLPLAIVGLVPLLLAAGVVYPWGRDPGTAGPGVAALYLNRGSVALRSVALLGGLALFARVVRHRGAAGALACAVALLFYGGLMNLLSFDWLLSLAPRYTSSAIGMQVIVGQLASALCWTVLRSSAREGDPVWRDYAGLLLATVMGEGYLVLMTFVIHWYGNLPQQAAWYMARSAGPWALLEAGGALLGVVAPLLALLFGAVRGSGVALRRVAWLVLAGLVVEDLWLVAPARPESAGWTALAGVLAVATLGSLALAVTRRFGPAPDPQREAAHGV